MRKAVVPSSLAVVSFLAVLANLLTAASAVGGQLIVPVAGGGGSDGRGLSRTKVWISNPGSADERAAVTFVESGADGVARRAGATQVDVPAGRTVLLSGLVPDGRSGLLEVASRADLQASATLELVGAAGNALASTGVQVLSPPLRMAGGEVARLEGLRRTAGSEVTNLALLNLAEQAARCQVSAFGADGAQIGTTAEVGVPALGARQLDDAFGILGQAAVAGGRFEVTCAQPFYAYATVSRRLASATLETSPTSERAGKAEPSEIAEVVTPTRGGGQAAGVIVFTVPGLFLHATAANSLASYALPARPGARYQRATVDFDLTIREFNKVLLFTGVTSLRRPANKRLDRVLYYAMQLVNRNQKTVLDLGVQDRLARTQGPWQSGHTYHLRFTYDLRQRVVRLDAFENGQHIYELHGPALHPDLSANANPLTVDFGQTGIGDGAYGPPLGWDYANLSLRLDP